MYINKEIYTYPDPRSPIPMARLPDGPGSVKRTNNCSGCCPRQLWENTWKKNTQGCLPGNQRPGTITRTILRVIPMRLGDPDSKYDMCLGIPQPDRHNPNNLSAYRPRSWAFPCWTAKKTGLAGGQPPPPSVPVTLLPPDYIPLQDFVRVLWDFLRVLRQSCDFQHDP